MTDYGQTIAQQGEKIESLAGDFYAFRKTVSDSFGTVNTTLAKIEAALQVRDATTTSIREIISYVRDVAFLVMMGAGAIVYVVQASTSATQAITQYQMSESIEFRKTIQRERNDELADLRKLFRQKSGS